MRRVTWEYIAFQKESIHSISQNGKIQLQKELVRCEKRPILNNEQDDAALVAGGRGRGRGRNRSRGRTRIKKAMRIIKIEVEVDCITKDRVEEDVSLSVVDDHYRKRCTFE